MENANRFRSKLQAGGVCVGTGISFTDPTVTEALCGVFDFLWIDTEHNALPLDVVQGHIMATKGTQTTPLVRVPWNDPVLIKPVLDIGAAGIIVPMIRTAEDVRQAVAACLYPPAGIRGFGPRRASNYGAINDGDFCKLANATILPIVQIENLDAVRNLDEILRVPGLAGIVVGPGDLSISMGYIGERDHPNVQEVIQQVLLRTRETQVFAGIASGDDPNVMNRWIDFGAQWVCLGNDTSLMLRAARQVSSHVRRHLSEAVAKPFSV
jgi:2-keto-3-deoxy-L-rhamnonate aldolase RhmA